MVYYWILRRFSFMSCIVNCFFSQHSLVPIATEYCHLQTSIVMHFTRGNVCVKASFSACIGFVYNTQLVIVRWHAVIHALSNPFQPVMGSWPWCSSVFWAHFAPVSCVLNKNKTKPPLSVCPLCKWCLLMTLLLAVNVPTEWVEKQLLGFN